MKTNIQTVLNRINNNIKKFNPETMDDLIEITHSTTGSGNYGSSFSIKKSDDEVKGVQVMITGRSKTHILPGLNQVYPVKKGLEKYISAGWNVSNIVLKS